MMGTLHHDYLERAAGAMSRGDYLSALQYGLRASAAPAGQEQVRCDAYMLLALTSLEMGMAEQALSFAVGAHLSASRARDAEREMRAASLVAVVVAHFPHLGEAPRRALH